MGGFLTALAVFVGSHLIVAAPAVRRRLTAGMGDKTYLIAYGVMSVFLFWWLFSAYFDAPRVQLWHLGDWPRWLAVLTMPIPCLLVAVGLSSRNPFSLGAGARGFDPDRPGIVGLTRHPALWGLVLWSLLHLPANGDLAGVIMFALFAGLAAIGPHSLDLKRRAAMGEQTWAALVARTRKAPVRLNDIGWWRIAGGIGFYLTLLLGHGLVIGVDPLAGLVPVTRW